MNASGDNLDGSFSRKVPKKGRRAGLIQPPQNDNETTSNITDSLPVSPTTSIDDFSIPSRSKKMGGWADETVKPNKSKSNKNLIEQERFRNPHIDESDDDIPVIPDIEEIDDDRLSLSINDTHALSKISAYKELDTDLLREGVFDVVSSLDGIDLSILTRFLQQESEVTESEEPWTWDSLFTEIASSLTSRDEIEDDTSFIK